MARPFNEMIYVLVAVVNDIKIVMEDGYNKIKT